MGRHRLRLKYLNKVLRRGKWYWYLRRDGQRTPLPDPTADDFLDRYYAALAGQPKPEIGASRTIPGTINSAIVSYYNSAAFKSLAPETQRTRRNTFERFRAEHGSRRTAELNQKHVRILLDAKADTPFMARNFLKTLRGLMQHCIEQGFRQDDPTRDVRYTRIPKDRQGGFLTWTEDQIATFEQKYPTGSRARLAFALLLYTGQRRSDVLRMGRQHIDDGLIRVKQQKTGVELLIPIHQDLLAIIDGTPKENLTFLLTEHGSAFSPAGFTNLFRRWVKDAGLPAGLSAHGLRKACCRRLAEAGCSAPEIMAISGHTSLKEVQRYIAAADQTRMAKAAITAITRKKNGTSSGKPE